MHDEEQSAIPEHNPTMSSDGVPLQTIRRSFEEIAQDEEPWLPLGNFMHQFFGYYKYLRHELVCEPIAVPEKPSPEQLRWAAFCAASVEYLCKKYEISCPGWALDPRYVLREPWYYGINADHSRVQEHLRETTPEEFSRRNIYCGDRTFRNKYEYKGRQHPKTV